MASGLRGLARGAPVGDGRGPRADAELGVDPPDVVLHRLLGQEQPGGDLAVGLPVGDERHDLGFSRGQPGRLAGAVRAVQAGDLYPDACPGTVQREAITPARSRILMSVHLTSGCGQLSRIASIHEGASKCIHTPTWVPWFWNSYPPWPGA